ncbi:class II fructose-bisphosphate aldolase [Caproicibacter sp. BJN0012]|uniref:class II fructose-bisphosphate aldolase n=1 Tax=Caproicibacter sp. BJN0012 TaxID=3110227 RepID=UPI002E132400
MSLVNLNGILDDARKNKYGVGAFDVSNHDMALAVLDVAQELKSPVILMGLTVDLGGDKLGCWIEGLKAMAKKAAVPVCIHLDHATDLNFIKKCVDSGFSSVMFDGSTLPIADNIKITKQVVEYAHKFNVSVEAELGHVGNGIVGDSEENVKKSKSSSFDNPEDFLTDPADMIHFIQETEVDALAVAVGTSHGVYVHPPKLHFERLEKLNSLSPIPMVMHGGSGTPDDQIRRAVSLGICKLNIYSELLAAFYSAMKQELNETENMTIWVSTANKRPIAAMKEVVKKKILLLGSNNRI